MALLSVGRFIVGISVCLFFTIQYAHANETQQTARQPSQQEIDAANDAAQIFILGCGATEEIAITRLKPIFDSIARMENDRLPEKAVSALEVTTKSGSVVLARYEGFMCTVIAGKLHDTRFQGEIMLALKSIFDRPDIGKFCHGPWDRKTNNGVTSDTLSYVFNAKAPQSAKFQVVVTTWDKVSPSGVQAMATMAPTNEICR